MNKTRSVLLTGNEFCGNALVVEERARSNVRVSDERPKRLFESRVLAMIAVSSGGALVEGLLMELCT